MTEQVARSSEAGIPGSVWYWRPAGQSAFLALCIVMLASMTLLFARLAGAVLAGLVLGGLELVLGGVLIAALSPLVMLRADFIRIWHGFKFTNITISQIAGVGMLYIHRVGSGGYWVLTIWRDDKSMEMTGVTYLLGGSPRLAPGKGPRWVRQADYDPAAASELPALNASRAASIGMDIYRRVLAVQGPQGQLATRHLECHRRPFRPRQYEQVIAHWSPHGQVGHCH